MSALPLSLDIIRVNSTLEGLSLSVATSISFVCPDSHVESVDFSQLSTLLSSGQVWVSRGIGCRLNFRLCLNGIPLTQLDPSKVIEDLAESVVNAPVSSTLFKI